MPVIGEEKRPSYEGLNDLSADLWRKFLALYADRFDSFEYNVRVGRGLDPGPSVSEEMRRMWFAVTTKRIDVVAERENQTWVIEIEDRPGARTFGQVNLYMQLLPKYHPFRDIIIGAVISARMGFDMAGAFRNSQILYFVFPPSGLPKLPPQFLPAMQSPAWSPQEGPSHNI